MRNRLPAYLKLGTYGITAEQIVRAHLGCEPEAFGERVIVTPHWPASEFAEAAESTAAVMPDRVYEVRYRGDDYTLIRSGIGAPQTGDVILALGCTPCRTLIFTGSMAGLSADMRIGDLMVAERSFCGDGFSRYLAQRVVPDDCQHEPAKPNQRLTRQVSRLAREACTARGIALHRGNVFSIDTILAQFSRLAHMTDELGCTGLEMETAAVFRAARLVGIRAAALLIVSDLPAQGKSLYFGRAVEEMVRYRTVRRQVLARVVLEILRTAVA